MPDLRGLRIAYAACRSRHRYAYLSHGDGRSSTCWWAYPSSRLPDRAGWLYACGAGKRYVDLRGASGRDCAGLDDGDDRVYARGADGRHDGAWRRDCPGVPDGDDWGSRRRSEFARGGVEVGSSNGGTVLRGVRESAAGTATSSLDLQRLENFMSIILRGISGPGKDIEVVLDQDHGVSVGRNASCKISLPHDYFLSGVHFEVVFLNEQFILRDLSSTNGTFINGVRTQEKALEGKETIKAGQSTFQIETDAVAIPTLVEVLSSRSEHLYAVLDTARDPTIYPLLLRSGGYYLCLYSGATARKLEAVAPYLVHLPPHSELLRDILDRGWSNSWEFF
jgi:hypothetical protein